MASPYRQLDAAIDEAVLVSLEVDPASRRVTVRLAVVIGNEPDSPRRERTLVLHDVSRVAAWLRGVRYGDDPGQQWAQEEMGPAPEDIYPPIVVSGVHELNNLLRRWSGHELYGQADEVFDAEGLPGWLGQPSLDLAWPGGPPEVHTLDLWLGSNARVGAHMLDLWIEFGRLEVLGQGNRRPASGGKAAGGYSGSGGRPGGGHPGPSRRGAQRPAMQRGQDTVRRPSARVRRRRAAAVLGTVIMVGVVLAAWAELGRDSPRQSTVVRHTRTAASPRKLPAAESGLLPWQLAAPISREVVVAGSRGRLIILGGLTDGGVSASGIFSVRTGTGSVSSIGSLRAALHDAAGAVLGGRTLVFGGGSSATVAAVQVFPPHGTGTGGARRAMAAAAGSLPAPRSDLAAVTIGTTAYVVGGYDGSRPDASVLATTNGRTFRAVATLPARSATRRSPC